MKIHKYCIEDKVSWDEHIRSSKVPHFMFMRDYMDYHSDRFIDCSLIFKNEKEKILGVLPANLSDSVLHSHQGLSFGGIILSRSALASDVHNIFSELITWCKDRNLCEKLVYKRTPDIYSIQPSQEDLYFLGLLDAHVFRRDLSTCIDLQSSFDFQVRAESGVSGSRPLARTSTTRTAAVPQATFRPLAFSWGTCPPEERQWGEGVACRQASR